jgi:hypothetical protein
MFSNPRVAGCMQPTTQPLELDDTMLSTAEYIDKALFNLTKQLCGTW